MYPPPAATSQFGLRHVMSRFALAIACVASASATLELTSENFDEEVFKPGRAAFVKFLAPW